MQKVILKILRNMNDFISFIGYSGHSYVCIEIALNGLSPLDITIL